MRIIVAGGRDFTDYDLMRENLDFFLKNHAPDIEIVCGEALGADSLGKFYAQRNGYNVLSYPADWNKFGKSAGIRRNKQMADIADALVAFWDGKSRGTANMIKQMQTLKKPVRIVYYNR